MAPSYLISPPTAPTRKLTILAQDPTVCVHGHILTAEAEIPYEALDPGPRGHRVGVIDFDSSTGTLYRPAAVPVRISNRVESVLGDPAFHAQNVYAIVMRTLARFEFALGRRVAWSFDGHQLYAAPHAFQEANAYYSKQDRGLFFGYFNDERRRRIFTCLSADVVAHETTHALVDGLRERYTFPSSPDQAAFHEGLADVVALLSIFSLPNVVEALLDEKAPKGEGLFIQRASLTVARLRETALFGLGEEVDPRRSALRRSVAIPPKATILSEAEYAEPHRRGEVLVAAMMNAFLQIWRSRIAKLGDGRNPRLYRETVAEAGRRAADHLLTMAIRALDFAPAADLLFGDYLSALLTADMEIQPDDSRFGYRATLLKCFASYGITPASHHTLGDNPGVWEPPDGPLSDAFVHFESLRHDPDEVFRFLWENRKALRLDDRAYTRVISVRPSTRLSTDGFTVRETVAEYVQILDVTVSELGALGLTPPKDMDRWLKVTLYGGGALVFDEFGRLKYHVRNRILNARRQNERLAYLWRHGAFSPAEKPARRFAAMHRLRASGGVTPFTDAEVRYGQVF